MPPKIDKRPVNVIKDLTVAVGKLTGDLNAKTVREIVKDGKLRTQKMEQFDSFTQISKLQESLLTSQTEAKLSTSCVNTQYKLLQRLFILRVRESREIINRLKMENSELKVSTERQMNELISKLRVKEEKIEQLETHLTSLHFQLERVVLEMADKFQSLLEKDHDSWIKDVDIFHEESVKIMRRTDLGFAYL